MGVTLAFPIISIHIICNSYTMPTRAVWDLLRGVCVAETGSIRLTGLCTVVL